MSAYPNLFAPGKIGRFLTRNRLVMAPMATNLASINGEVSERLLAYYRHRARGGAGTVIVEAASVDNPLGKAGAAMLCIDHPRFVSGLKRLSESIQAYNSLAMIQLSHAGRQTYRTVIEGMQPVAPSPLPCPIVRELPRELKVNDIDRLVARFADAASLAGLAGFNGVEIHACHGYLINQFLSPHSNLRSDEYGGSLENRQRFLLRILKAINKAVPDLLVSVRINIDDFVEGGLGMEESLQICRCLESHGADIIHASSGTYASGLTSIESGSYAEGWRMYLAEAVKQQVKIPVIGGGMIEDPARAEQAIARQEADFIFIGRNLLADPRWPQHSERGETGSITPCIRCNNCIEGTFKGMSISCTVNPETGREVETRTVQPSEAAGKSAWIAGAGPAGLQAALALARRGVRVTVFGKDQDAGGLMKIAALPPFKQRIEKWRSYLVRSLDSLDVKWRLGEAFEPSMLDQEQPDLLVLAVGSSVSSLSIDGVDQDICVDALSVFNDTSLVKGKSVLILGGGLTGCELADLIAGQAAEISIVEKDSVLAAGMEKKNRRSLMNRLNEADIESYTGFRAREINEKGLIARSSDDSDIFIPADLIILATGFKSNAGPLYEAVKDRVAEVYTIGDAYRPRGFKEAVLEGHKVAERFISTLYG